jgi:hypothetical protein
MGTYFGLKGVFAININTTKFKFIKIGIPILILLLIGGIFLFNIIIPKPMVTQYIVTESIKVADNKIQLTGTTSSSAALYEKYTYKLENEKLYIKLYYSTFSFKSKTGNFNITLNGDYKTLKAVYLQGSSKDDVKCIWTGN